MNCVMRRRYQRRAKVIRAMGHETRLAIVERLARGACCVCVLHEMIGGDFSTVSRHLAVLRAAGIVESEKRGLKVFYSLRTPCILGFLECVERVVAEAAAPASRRGRR
jgi:ArsR family transcriptional regulator